MTVNCMLTLRAPLLNSRPEMLFTFQLDFFVDSEEAWRIISNAATAQQTRQVLPIVEGCRQKYFRQF